MAVFIHKILERAADNESLDNAKLQVSDRLFGLVLYFITIRLTVDVPSALDEQKTESDEPPAKKRRLVVRTSDFTPTWYC